ncbi:MAG: penicillin-binding protein 2 [Bacillota bacterium]|nr:penicillin-binding protein 2 [Bacillota bacterium]
MINILKNRFTILLIVFITVFSVMAYQIFNLQIANGQYYDTQSQHKLLSNREVVAPRGKITDRNGIPIAENGLSFIVQITKTKIKNADFNAMLLRLANIFEKNKVSYGTTLRKYLSVNPVSFGPLIKNTDSGIKTWIKQSVLASKDAQDLHTAQDMFDYFKNKRFLIDPSYSDADAYKIMLIRYDLSMGGYSSINPVIVATDVNSATVAEIEEMHDDFPGVSTDAEPVRSYADGADIGNVLGYVGAINPDEYSKLKNSGYNLNDSIGKDGIEKEAEKYLKGTDGVKTIEVDTSGRQTDEVNQHPPIPGDDVQLTIDMNMQKIAMDSLKRNIDIIKNRQGPTDVPGNLGDANAGAVVAMDVNTGEILAMASYPSYDPTLFLSPPTDKDAQKSIAALYSAGSGSPTFNRAIAGRYAPGSTFKPIVGIAGLEDGIITPDYIVDDTGVMTVDGMKFYCMEYKDGKGAHGPINFSKALAVSDNIYFHTVGLMDGIDRIDKWANLFGLGKLTGVDLPGEYKGILASPAFKKTINPYRWGRADTAQASIGQLYNAFTPIELANYMSTLANGGKMFTPHLIKNVTKPDGTLVKSEDETFNQIPLKKSTQDATKQGMVAVTNSEDGTAVSVFKDFPFTVAGKTGTAETGDTTHSNNGVFVCYAPADNPKIAVAVVIERGVFGYFAAPVAKDIMSEYFKLNGSSAVGETASPNDITFTQ